MYHISKHGPDKCHAKPGNCPLNTQHFTTFLEAQDFYESTNNTFIIHKSIKPVLMKNSYIGSVVNIPNKFKEDFQRIVGKTKASSLNSKRIERDGTDNYHVTIIDPKEYRILKKKNIKFEIPSDFKIIMHGIGKVEEPGNESWYVVCSSHEIQKYRKTIGLPEKSLHITLGFKVKDIFNQEKDKSTIVY